MTMRQRRRKREKELVRARSATVRMSAHADLRPRDPDVRLPDPEPAASPADPAPRPVSAPSERAHDHGITDRCGPRCTWWSGDWSQWTLADLRKFASLTGLRIDGKRPTLCTKSQLLDALAAVPDALVKGTS